MRILHLALEPDWVTAREAGTYIVSTRDATLQQVGFIHCSTPAQVDGVAQNFYADVLADLVVLELDDEQIRASGTEVRYEDPGNGDLYPHIYGPIDPAWVTGVSPYTPTRTH